MRIFVPTSTRLDITKLESEGVIIECVSPRLTPLAGNDMMEAFVEAFDQEGFDPAEDQTQVRLTTGVSLLGGRLRIAAGDDTPPLWLYYWLRFVIPGAILLVGIWWILTDLLGVMGRV